MAVESKQIPSDRTAREQVLKDTLTSRSIPLNTKIYQLFRISSFIVFFCLLTRCLVLYPLVSNKFLPGGIHIFLIYTILITNWFETIVINCLFYKNLNVWKVLSFINVNFFIYKCWFKDDYEYNLILKNYSYALFIISLSLASMYYHGTRIFKSNGTKNRTKTVARFANIILIIIMYLTQFNLMLLSVDNKNIWEKVFLVLYFPIALSALRRNYNKL